MSRVQQELTRFLRRSRFVDIDVVRVHVAEIAKLRAAMDADYPRWDESPPNVSLSTPFLNLPATGSESEHKESGRL